MQNYISDKEIACLMSAPEGSLQKELFNAICQRVKENTASDMLKQEKDAQHEWYHLVRNRLSEASFVYRVTHDETLGRWIHNRIMEMVAMPEDAWIGPWFRKRQSGPQVATLETAGIACAICEACLNAKDVFSDEELNLVYHALSDTALVLLERHINKLYFDDDCIKNNWFMVTNCAYGMTAAVLGKEKEVEKSLEVLKLCLGFFNHDSYGETVHYADYASTNISKLTEVLYRLGYIEEKDIPMEATGNMLEWYASSIQDVQYAQEEDAFIPMAFNFGDCNLHMCFHADKLIQTAVRMKHRCKIQAGLASWLFFLPYRKDNEGNKKYCTGYYGITYLGLLMLPDMPAPMSPEEANLSLVKRFDIGHILVRDHWNNPRMQLAIAAGADGMNTSSHRHPDQNSFLLTMGKERMLIDPGTCCYRLWSWKNAKDERSHSVISLFKDHELLLQHLVSAKDGAGYLNKLQIFESFKDTWIVASDAAGLYDSEVVEKAVRIWVICMPNIMFVADYVVAKEPLSLETSFVVNNEDAKLFTMVHSAQDLEFRRGSEVLRLCNTVNLVDGIEIPTELVYDWTFAHHRSSSQPNQPGQAKEGSGLIYRFHCGQEGKELHRVQRFVMNEGDEDLDFKFVKNGFEVQRKNEVSFFHLN